ncbi:acyltransferase family protein [Hymenobacter cellulosivorans]|uniref:Acyltransferase n=1 Tax=Hymenobacter cellulosivorans TaxID=2932249 RepID=A0ABY4FGP7_9BACT|nr:acyltransferase [Hymenobacter cellulosivorans]UOQ55188.1 acyltransferase [Hymenobacter cellulosivorans]
MRLDTKQIATPAAVKSLSYQELDILHSLRGFCAFYVVIYHAKYILWSGGRQYLSAFPRTAWNPLDYMTFLLDMLSSAGYEMVVFFFVLSGFFIRYAQRKKHRQPIAFYINRIVRIYPPYLVSILLGATILLLIGHYVPTALDATIGRELNTDLATAWTELHAFNVGSLGRLLSFMPLGTLFIGHNVVHWSLLPEALFYLIIPLAFWRIRVYYFVSVGAFLLGVFLTRSGHIFNPVTTYFCIYNFYFAVGVALYDSVVDTNWLASFRRANGWLMSLVIIGLFLALIPLAILKLKLVSGLVATVLAVLAVSTLLAGRVARQNVVVRFMHSIGIFSFSLYLFHYPMLLLCYGVLVYSTGQQFTYVRYYWLAVPIVTLLSYALYWVTERVSVNYFRKV